MLQTDAAEPETYEFAALNMVFGSLKVVAIILKVIFDHLKMVFALLKMLKELLKAVLVILKVVKTTNTTFKDALTLVSTMKKPVGVLKKLDLLQKPSSKRF